MPLLYADWDPESEGSRFTQRPALALLAGEFDEDRPIRDIVTEYLGDDERLLLEPGEPKVVTGGLGRGAEGLVPVVEWAAQGIVGGVAFAATAALASKLRGLVNQLRQRSKRISISRGMAAHLALDELVRRGSRAADVAIEAVEEPASLRGEKSHEFNYVAIEPWICLLVDARRRRRFILVIRDDGELLAVAEAPLTDGEGYFAYPPVT